MFTLALVVAGFVAFGLAAGLVMRPWIAVITLVLFSAGLLGVVSLGDDSTAADVGRNDMSPEAGAVLTFLFYVVPTSFGCAAGMAFRHLRRRQTS